MYVCLDSPVASYIITEMLFVYLSAPPKVRSGDVPYQDQDHICFPRRAWIFHTFVWLLSSQQLPKGLPIARAHSVKHEDVEGGIEVGQQLLDPLAKEVEVVVATSNVHFWQNEPRDVKEGDGQNTGDEEH